MSEWAVVVFVALSTTPMHVLCEFIQQNPLILFLFVRCFRYHVEILYRVLAGLFVSPLKFITTHSNWYDCVVYVHALCVLYYYRYSVLCLNRFCNVHAFFRMRTLRLHVHAFFKPAKEALKNLTSVNGFFFVRRNFFFLFRHVDRSVANSILSYDIRQSLWFCFRLCFLPNRKENRVVLNGWKGMKKKFFFFEQC